MARLAAAYAPRRPEETALYRLVKEHGEEFLRHARDTYEGPLPRYVEDELSGYLRCGDFSRGFVHLTCARCKDDLLVAFSCKARGLCPSCAGRRMAAQAAHLVDAVVPNVPLRQYVMSFPFELSALAATKPDVLRALARIFAEALGVRYRAAAKRAGCTGKTHPGAVTFVHRYGSTLNSHVHFHVAALDGVFVSDRASVRFIATEAPTRSELHEIASRVALRVTAWLQKRGYLRDEADASNDRGVSFEEALSRAAMQRGTLALLRNDDEGDVLGGKGDERITQASDAVTHQGFNLHASVTIRQGDDMGRERLFRYGLRPPFAVSRLRFLRDGSVAYRIKKPGRDGRVKARIMTPIECLARLCALIPPPRYPLTRFSGVLAPRAKLRPLVVPRLPTARPCHAREPLTRTEPMLAAPPQERRERPLVPSTPIETAHGLAQRSGDMRTVAPNILALEHVARLRGGLLYAATSQIPWAILLERTFDVDVRACKRCDGRLRVRAVVTQPDVARRILDALRKKRGRDPPLAPAAA